MSTTKKDEKSAAEVTGLSFEDYVLSLEKMTYAELKANTKKVSKTADWDKLTNQEKMNAYVIYLKNVTIMKALNSGQQKAVKFYILTPDSAKLEKPIFGDVIYSKGASFEYLKDHTVMRDQIQNLQYKPANKSTDVTFVDEEGRCGSKGAKITFSRAGFSAIGVNINSKSLNALKIVK